MISLPPSPPLPHSEGMIKPLQAVDLPSRLLLDSVVCLLRTLVVGMSMHCQTLNMRHTHSLPSLLHYVVKSGTRTGTIEAMFNMYVLHNLIMVCANWNY